MERKIGDFKFSITQQEYLDGIVKPQLIIMNLIDKFSNEWHVEFIDFFETEKEAELAAIAIIEVLAKRDSLVEEEII